MFISIKSISEFETLKIHFESVNAILKILTMPIDFSVGIQSNEYPSNQESFSASPRKNA